MTLIFNLGLLTGIRSKSFTVAWEPYSWPYYWRSFLSSQLPLTAHKSSCYMSGCWRCPILCRCAQCKSVTVVSFSAATVLCPALPCPLLLPLALTFFFLFLCGCSLSLGMGNRDVQFMAEHLTVTCSHHIDHL